MSLKDYMRKKAEGTGQLPPVWKPNEGDELFGIVEKIVPSPWVEGAKLYCIKTEDGKVMATPGNVSLLRQLAEYKPVEGDYIYIQCLGDQALKGGRKVKLFNVSHVSKAEAGKVTSGQPVTPPTTEPVVAPQSAPAAQPQSPPTQAEAKTPEAVKIFVGELFSFYGTMEVNTFKKYLERQGFEYTPEEAAALCGLTITNNIVRRKGA